MTSEQRGVLQGMVAAMLITAFTLTGACLAWSPAQTSTNLNDRMALFAMSALFPCLALLASIARLASHRFFTQQDIGGSASPRQTDTARLLQALLQNTLEQAVLGIAIYAVWAILAPAHLLPAVPAASALFLLGRILFFVRYESGAAARSFGFAVTFYPTVALTLGNCVFLATRVLEKLQGV